MFKRAPSIMEHLRSANPVPSTSGAFAESSTQLRAKVDRSIEGVESPSHARLPVASDGSSLRPLDRSSRGRRRLVYGLALVAVVIGASPALGVRPSFLPFFGAEKASRPVQLDFESLSTGAPSGMDPRAIGSEARKITDSHFGGGSHALFVAPTAEGGFCYEWTPGYGGCDASGQQTLDAIGELAGVAGTTLTAPLPPGSTVRAGDSRAQALHAKAIIPLWVVGFIRSGDAQGVSIRFKDGRVVKSDIIWVSEPISAGFFAYDIPPDRRSASNHAVAVEATGRDGAVVQEQVISSDGG